jgi:hypothetical protein
MPDIHPGQFRFHPDFRPEFAGLDAEVKEELAATILAVRSTGGPAAGRPYVDTLKGSRHQNMKELRFHTATEVWRFAFAYDPTRNAVVLCGGGKQGGSEKEFYDGLVKQADKRYDKWLKTVEEAKAKDADEKRKLAKTPAGQKGGRR